MFRNLAFAFLGMGMISVAQAAQPARVEAPSAVVREFPESSSREIVVVGKGEPLTISNYPIQGFYKVRTQTGQVGFVSQSELTVGTSALQAVEADAMAPPMPLSSQPPPPSYSQPPPAYPPPTQYQQPVPPPYYGAEDRKQHSPLELKSGLRLFGGLSFFRLKDFESTLGVTNLANGTHFGAEYRHPFSDRWSLLFRGELIQGKWTAVGVTSDYDVTASVIPMQAGLSYTLHHSESLEVALGGLIGAGIGAKGRAVSATDPDDDTTYGGMAIGGSLKLDGNYWFSNWGGFYAEAGMRFFDVPMANPTSTGASPASAFIENQEYVQQKVQFTGAFFSGGIQFRF